MAIYRIQNRPLNSVLNQQASKNALADLATMAHVVPLLRSALEIEERGHDRKGVKDQIREWIATAEGQHTLP